MIQFGCGSLGNRQKTANDKYKSWHWYAEFLGNELKLLPGIRAYPVFGVGPPTHFNLRFMCFFYFALTILTRFCMCFDFDDLIDSSSFFSLTWVDIFPFFLFFFLLAGKEKNEIAGVREVRRVFLYMQTQTKISVIKFVKYKNLMVIKNIVKVFFNIGKCVIYF